MSSFSLSAAKEREREEGNKIRQSRRSIPYSLIALAHLAERLIELGLLADDLSASLSIPTHLLQGNGMMNGTQ